MANSKADGMFGATNTTGVKAPYQLINMETALLIATAASREVDVNVWFNQQAYPHSRIPVRDFDAKLTGLAVTMGINQDQDVKKELELATSVIALRMVHVVCAAGEDDRGQPLIDLNYFLKLCQEKVDDYLNQMNEEEKDILDTSEPVHTNNFRSWTDGAYDIHGHPIPQPADDEDYAQDDFEEDQDQMKLSVEQYISESRARAEGDRPKSAPVGKRAASRGETTQEALLSSSSSQKGGVVEMKVTTPSNIVVIESKVVPSSPYDEAIEFHYNDPDNDIDDEETDREYLKSRSRVSNSNVIPTPMKQEAVDWNEQNHQFLIASSLPSSVNHATTSATKPRPSSVGPELRHRGVTEKSTNAPPPIRSASAERTTRPQQQQPQGGREQAEGGGGGGDLEGGGVPRRRRSFSNNNRSFSIHSTTHTHTHNTPEGIKETVSDLIRNTVKKTDLYHLIQVHLGFIDSYTLIPPRGVIVQSIHKEYLHKRDLQIAFMAARLMLNDVQIHALKALVVDFADFYRRSYQEKQQQQQPPNKSLDNINLGGVEGSVKGPNNSISAEWLRRYLVHVRLSKARVIPVVTSSSLANLSPPVTQANVMDNRESRVVAATTNNVDFTGEEGETQEEKNPLLWSTWLEQKLRDENKNHPNKPKEFLKALNGEPHPLTKEDIDILLRTHPILPSEALQKEIEYRIEGWILDTDGRRDFQHQLNVKLRMWIWQKLIKEPSEHAQSSTNILKLLPKDEQGYWKLYDNLPQDRKFEVKNTLLQDLIEEKRKELQSSERLTQDISRSLYWQYDTQCSRNGGNKNNKSAALGGIAWHNWLPTHLKKCEAQLDKFKLLEAERNRQESRLKKQKRSVATLNTVIASLEQLKVDFRLDSYHSLQLTKAMVALRRAVRARRSSNVAIGHVPAPGTGTVASSAAHHQDMIAGSNKDTVIASQQAGSGDIVTKEDFDQHIRGVLAPYLTLTDTTTTTASNAERISRFAQEWERKIHDLFHSNCEETVQKAMEENELKRLQSRKSYDSWLLEKKKVQSDHERKMEENRHRAKREKDERHKKSLKAYDKWVKLRNKQKYKSMVDKKSHAVPAVRIVEHKSRWTTVEREKDLPPPHLNETTGGVATSTAAALNVSGSDVGLARTR